MHSIILKDLEIGYKKPLTKPINLEINESDFIVMIGENGAGKTTLINTILNLTKKISGEIIFKNLNEDDIAYLPQSTSIANDFPATVSEVVLSGTSLSLSPLYSKDDKIRVINIMRDLNLIELKDKKISKLSGGQRQKVLLARSLASPKKIIFVDEPTNNLDEKSVVDFFEILDSINKNGTTIVMISHDKNSFIKNAKSIIKFENGEVFYYKVETNA